MAINYAKDNNNNEINRFLSLAIEMVGSNVMEIISFFKNQDQWGELPNSVKDLLIKNKNSNNVSDLINSGYLYTVTINPNNMKLFNWDENIIDEKLLSKFNFNGSGKEFYKMLTTKLGSDKQASLFLHSIGYYAITYRVNSGDELSSKNFVVFNQSDVNISSVERL